MYAIKRIVPILEAPKLLNIDATCVNQGAFLIKVFLHFLRH